MKILILTLFCLISKVISVDLVLPFNAEEGIKIKTTKYQSFPPLVLEDERPGYIHNFYESYCWEPIKKITFRGQVIFHDKSKRRHPFRRLVCFGVMDNRALLTSYSGTNAMKLEVVLYIANNTVYDIMKATEFLKAMKESLVPRSDGAVLKSVFFKLDDGIDNQKTKNSLLGFRMIKMNEVSDLKIEEDVKRIYEKIIVQSEEFPLPPDYKLVACH